MDPATLYAISCAIDAGFFDEPLDFLTCTGIAHEVAMEASEIESEPTCREIVSLAGRRDFSRAIPPKHVVIDVEEYSQASTDREHGHGNSRDSASCSDSGSGKDVSRPAENSQRLQEAVDVDVDVEIEIEIEAKPVLPATSDDTNTRPPRYYFRSRVRSAAKLVLELDRVEIEVESSNVR